MLPGSVMSWSKSKPSPLAVVLPQVMAPPTSSSWRPAASMRLSRRASSYTAASIGRHIQRRTEGAERTGEREVSAILVGARAILPAVGAEQAPRDADAAVLGQLLLERAFGALAREGAAAEREVPPTGLIRPREHL